MYVSRLEDGRITVTDITSKLDMSCDVLCVGAGSAGIYAADAAARGGARVILLENDVNVGGMHVLGRVYGCYYGFDGGSFENDIYKEKNPRFHNNSFRIDYKHIAEAQRLRRSGVELLCRHTPTGVLLEGDRVVGLAVFNGEREIYVGSRIVIDATSDGHLVRMMDVKVRRGREIDGGVAPFSVFSNYYVDGTVRQVNEDAGHIDQYDSVDFSRSVIRAHRDIIDVVGRGEFVHLATHTGVREGIAYEGEECLRYDDILLGRAPERVLFYAYSDFDRHGRDSAIDDELMQSFKDISNLSTVTARIPVPFGAVVPRGVRGFVTAGRCFSVDTHALGAVRMNKDMFRMGECVGTAAAMAVKAGVDFTEIDYAEYLARVRSYGCYDGDLGKDFGFDFPRRDQPYRAVRFDAVEENLPLLRTETPGVAIWSCFLDGSAELADRLVEALDSAEDELYRYNLAIALGIMNDARANGTLREIVRNRDCFYFKDCRRSNKFRSVIAVCLLGRLGTETDIPMLWEIAFDDGEFSREMYHTLEPDYLYCTSNKRNFVYFDMLTHAIAALRKILVRLGMPMDGFVKEIDRLLCDRVAIERTAPGCAPEDAPYAEILHFLENIRKLATNKE